MSNTPVFGWPYQALTDPPDGADLGEELALAIEQTLVGMNLDTLDDAWIAYTPTWTTFSGTPSIGNGTLAGVYKLLGAKTCAFSAFLQIGSTTNTAAPSIWRIGAPFTASFNTSLTLLCEDASTGLRYTGAGMIGGGASSVDRLGVPQGTAGVRDDSPFVWTTGDLLCLSGIYPIT